MKPIHLVFSCFALFLLVGISSLTHSAEAQSPEIQWRIEYFPNVWFSGESIKATHSGPLDFNWAANSPANGIPRDNFSARFSGIIVSPKAQIYEFNYDADDSFLISIGGSIWQRGSVGAGSGQIELRKGYNPFYIEFKEYTGDARLKFSMTPVGDITPPTPTPTPTKAPQTGNTKIEYFNNTWFGGEPVYTEYKNLDSFRRLLDWGTNSPAPGVNADFFSARISFGIILNGSGPYKFEAVADDTMRVLVNGTEVVKTTGAYQRASGTTNLSTYDAEVVVEYVEYVGGAFVDLEFSKTRIAKESRIVQQRFEGGWMIWLEAENKIYALFDNPQTFSYYSGWEDFNDTFVEGQPEDDPNIRPPAGKQQPRRGFGKVWREQENVRDLLGWATGNEIACDSKYYHYSGFGGRSGGTSLRMCDWQILSLGWSTGGRGWSISPYKAGAFD